MVEQVFKLTLGDKKIVEKIIFDENLNYLHMIFRRTTSSLYSWARLFPQQNS